MKNPLRYANALLKTLENAPLSGGSFFLSFTALILVRLAVEGAVSGFRPHGFAYFFYEFSHTFLFFGTSFALLLPLLAWLSGRPWKKAASVLLFGFLIILAPPVVDKMVFGPLAYWSFYQFDGFSGLFRGFFTLFGGSPQIGITYGVRLEVALVTLLGAFYVTLVRRSFVRGFLAAFALYGALYLLGTLPSWLTFLLLLPGGLGHALGFTSLDVAGFFLSPESILGHALRDPRSVLNIKMSLVYGTLLPLLLGTLLFRTKRGHFLALLRNSRLPQVVYHAGLVFLGILLAWVYAPPSPALSIFDALAALLLAFSAVLAWLSSVAVNDLYDVQIDRLTNPRRPLPTGAIPTADYLTYGALFFGGSLLLAGIVSFGALLALLAYQAIAFLYSAYPYRLKRFPIVATLLAALCGLLTISAGYLAASADLSLRSLPPRLFFFLGLTYTLLLPLKDLKDIAGDRRDGVYTLPVLLGEKKARLLLGGFAFLAFSVSPALLNLPKALFPAFLFGSAAFWLVQLSGQGERSFFCYHRLSGVMIALAFAYGICLTFLAFG